LQEGSTRSVTTELIIGLIIAAVVTFVYFDVSTELKLALVLFLGGVGLLNFLTLIQFWRKFGWKMTQWQYRISKRPEFIEQLHTFDKQIRQVLYERSEGHPSLSLEGTDVMEALSIGVGDKTLKSELADKIAMANVAYNELHQRIAERYRGYHWKTLEFAETLGSISGHFDLVNHIFPTVYRQVGLWPKDKPLPKEVRKKWEEFRTEYNTVLHGWKSFIEQTTHALRLGANTRAESVKELPERD